MPLESNPQTIADLDASWPVGADTTTDGDDHIKNIKRVLQNIFPGGSGGGGFDSPVLSTVDELNHLTGATSNIQDQIDALNGGSSAGKLFLAAPDDSILTWFKPTPPAGWVVSVDNPFSFYVSVGPVAKAGTWEGVVPPGKWSHSHAVQPFTLLEDQLPPHNHRLTETGDPGGRGIVHEPTSEFVLFTTGGSYYRGYTERNSSTNAAITQAITFDTEFDPLVYHSTFIKRDSSLDP